MYRSFLKPLADFFLAFFGLIVIAPILVILTVLLALSNKGKPFFFQPRPGKNEKLFNVIKFKTMTDKKNENGVLLPDSKRVTRLGKLIRKTSLDEIPQLINVLKGDMSLIGPRPLLPEYLNLYNEIQRKRHHVKPGITGWAQVNGRNAISWQKKFEYDVWYVDNVSVILDIKILIKTIVKVFKSEDINATGQATITPFLGNE